MAIQVLQGHCVTAKEGNLIHIKTITTCYKQLVIGIFALGVIKPLYASAKRSSAVFAHVLRNIDNKLDLLHKNKLHSHCITTLLQSHHTIDQHAYNVPSRQTLLYAVSLIFRLIYLSIIKKISTNGHQM